MKRQPCTKFISDGTPMFSRHDKLAVEGEGILPLIISPFIGSSDCFSFLSSIFSYSWLCLCCFILFFLSCFLTLLSF